MKCPKCKSTRISNANFCHKCGTNLELNGESLRGLKFFLYLLILVLFVSGALYFFYGILFPFNPSPEENVKQAKESPSTETHYLQVVPDKTEKDVGVSALQAKSNDSPLEKMEVEVRKVEENMGALPVGQVSIYDPWGIEIATLPAIVLDSSWLALPVRACLGGVRLFFHASGSDFSAEIDGARWANRDDVVLWHLEKPFPGNPVQLISWRSGGESFWRSLVSPKTAAAVPPSFDWQQGFFLHTPLPYFINEPGVFLEKGKVTGWTFGGWLEGGYFWNKEEDGIKKGIELTVEDFYSITFAGGREEYFIRAMAMDSDTVASERLQTFLDGFRREAKLDPHDVPESLHPGNVLKEVRALARELRQQGMPHTVIELVDDAILRQIRDFGLLKIVVGAFIATDDSYENAMELVEGLGDVFQEGVDSQDFSTLHLKLYQLWMGKVFEEGDFEAAWQVLARSKASFPDDPQLYLDGVALYLTQGNWSIAEDLLLARNYPAEMLSRVERLLSQISALKELEGNIVINFSPGSNHIPVKATVNESMEFQFLVDTGASLVSISPSMLAALGISITANTPRRRVATAGGMQEAWLVTLDSVEMQGWVVQNVEALVIDALESHDYGLLGLNFLSRFQMELDSDGGVLILKPR